MFSKKIIKLLYDLEEYKKTHKDAWNIPRDEAQFLYLFILAMRPKTILEVGTSTGYSTIWFALAAKEYGGKVLTLEYDPKKIEFANENFKKAGLEKTIRLIPGDANKTIKTISRKIDFVFLDSIKEEYLKQYKLIFPKLNKGGIIAADNAGDLADKMQDYLNYVRKSKDAFSVFNPIGNGVEFTYKK